MQKHSLWYRQVNVLIAIGFLCVGVVVFWYSIDLGILFPPRFSAPEIITIVEGDSAQTVARKLHERGIIRQPPDFILYLWILRKDTSLVPGQYVFLEPRSVPQIVRLITQTGTERTIRLLEGWTIFEMGRYFEEEGFFSHDEFITAAYATEGYLFPDTYRVFENIMPDTMVVRLRKTFDEKIKPLLPELERQKKTLKDIVIMASIIEKESSGDEDRALIAGILWKRLNARVPLQVDATLTYVTGKGSQDLTQDDLALDSPYNTYRYTGLPQGPIGNPGLKSINASLFPKQSPYWFYLHDTAGNVYFAETFEEHKENKKKYLK